MNPIIKINLESFKEISWTVVLLFFLKYMGLVPSQQMFIIYAIILVIMIGFAKKIIIPYVNGLLLYFVFIVYSTGIGLLLYETRTVVRDLYYVFPTVVVIVLGYYLKIVYNGRVNILKTIAFCGAMASTICFIKAFSNLSVFKDGESMRTAFDTGSYEIAVAFIIVFCAIFTQIEIRLFRTWINWVIFLLMLAQLVLSLARSVWIETIIGCIVVILMEGYINKNVLCIAKKVVIVAVFAFVGFTFFINIAPQSAVDTFFEKFENTSQELDSKQEFDSTTDAMNNWRGYENQSAKTQWQESSVFEEIFGHGMGKGTHLKYVPYTWASMVQNSEIPILHNGYYTVLSKGGIVGMMALVWFMLSNVIVGLKLITKRKDIQGELLLLITIEFIFMIQTYVVRGPVAQNVNLVTAILVGWINADIKREKQESKSQKIEEEQNDYNSLLLQR